MVNKKALKFVVFFSLVFFLLSFAFVLAQEERKLEVEYPEISGIKPETVKTGLPEYVKYIFSFGIIIFGLIVFGALIWGGVLYLTSAGQPTKLREAKDRIFSAFLGLVILLSSYLILTTINPQLVIFHPPLLELIKKVEAPPPAALKGEEVSLIALELPIGQMVEKELWNKEWRTKTENLIQDNENFLNEKIKIKESEITFDKIADLNKYLKSLTEECRCEELISLCTKPKDFAQAIGCAGDPCNVEREGINVRKEMEKILKIDHEKSKKLLDFQKKIIEEKKVLEEKLSKFQDVEQEMLSCQGQTKVLFDLNEYLSRLNFFREQGWKLETVTIPGAPKSQGDPLTFYCSVGGTIFDYPYPQDIEMPPEITVPELPREMIATEGYSCPIEFPLGEILDKLRESAVLLLAKLERLASLEGEMASKIEKMTELVSQCNDKTCKINCKCIPNPCYVCCSCCWGFFCTSPCLQAIGICAGEPCPRAEIAKITEEIKKTEDGIFLTINEIKEVFPQVFSLLEDKENPKNLNNIRQGMGLCYSPEIMEPTWAFLNCPDTIGNYGAEGQIIGNCHPRNFFCCTLSKEKISFPWIPPPPSELAYQVPIKKYEPLPSIKNCPEGWLCDESVSYYNQYNDASEPLKEFLSCLRENLNKIQEEKEIDKTKTIGRISSFSDSKLYTGTCSWGKCPSPGGCTHICEVKYGKERVSAHYGGPNCRYQRKSYAVDFGDEENADYIITAGRACSQTLSRQAYILFRAPGHYDHIHMSIGGAYQCGAN